MTELNSYIEAYNEAVAKNPKIEQLGPRCFWIADKWMRDVGLDGESPDFEQELFRFFNRDPELFEEVTSGLLYFHSLMHHND